MKLLVIGRHGQLARALVRAGGRQVIAVGRPDADLERPDTLNATLIAHAPDVVACVGAWTDVDGAERAPDAAMRINGEGPGDLARLCALRATPLIHVSTDYVFDGAKAGPYVETDAVAPQGAYGRSKAEGEVQVAQAHPHHVIVRTAWVYDAAGKNFARTMLRLARTRARIAVVEDQIGAPTFAAHAAEGLLAIARNLVAAPTPDMYGVFHMAAADAASWADFAEAIFAESAARGGPVAAVDRISTAQYPTPARRPANSRLACGKIARVHGVRLPPWRQGLAACLDEIAARRWDVD